MIPIPKQQINKLVTKMRYYDIHPLYLPDIDYLYGEKHPLTGIIDEIVAELSDYMVIANDDEIKETYDALDSYWREQINIDLFLNRDPQTIKLVALYLVVTITKQSHYDVKRYIKTNHRDQSDVIKIYPELANYEDDEGLIPFGTPQFIPAGVGGGIYYKEHLLFYHQFLRRNFTSNLNFPFINALVEYHKNHRDQYVAVALDYFRLMPKDMFRQILEKDHSFGPPLAIPSLDDPHAVGLTVHTFPPHLIPLHGYERAEFHWSYADGYKAFQVEEVYALDHLPDLSEEYILTRYIHSLRDINKKEFHHLDGAIMVYSRNRYEERYKKSVVDRVQLVDKIKVFRIDGKINNDEWSKLIGLFFQQNHLIAEYLNPQFFCHEVYG
jgi:hypothetical protein